MNFREVNEIQLDENELTFCLSEKWLQTERFFLILDHEMHKKGYDRIYDGKDWVYRHYQFPRKYRFTRNDVTSMLLGFEVVMDKIK